MSVIDELLQANKEYLAAPPVDYTQEDHHASKLPKKKLAIVTCMDTRLVNFLEPALGIERGDVKMIKVVGNVVTGVFDSVIKSLMVAIYELGVEEIAVIGHAECGMAKTTSESLTKAMLERGVSPDAIKMVEHELEQWADAFKEPTQNVRDAVEAIKTNPLLPKDVGVHGLLFHPRTGELTLLVE